jgi:DNA-binding NarL/FixJ family response regulator
VIELFRTQHERSESAALRGLGSKSYQAAFARGRAMTVEEGVAFALGGTQRPKQAEVVKPYPRPALTGRQLEIARLIADDLTNRQIAIKLHLSERTVETHVTNMLNKLGLNSRVQLSRWIADVAAERSVM